MPHIISSYSSEAQIKFNIQVTIIEKQKLEIRNNLHNKGGPRYFTTRGPRKFYSLPQWSHSVPSTKLQGSETSSDQAPDSPGSAKGEPDADHYLS
jgi:hypothetical protein